MKSMMFSFTFTYFFNKLSNNIFLFCSDLFYFLIFYLWFLGTSTLLGTHRRFRYKLLLYYSKTASRRASISRSFDNCFAIYVKHVVFLCLLLCRLDIPVQKKTHGYKNNISQTFFNYWLHYSSYTKNIYKLCEHRKRSEISIKSA